MNIKGKSVVGLNVVTIDNGSVVQTVDDIAYDPNDHRIVALLVDSGGLFSSAKAIHMDDVHNIGEDAVIIPDASVIKSVKELSSDVRSISDSNKHLVKTNVLTIDGKELGKVTDIYFDSSNGMVDSMEVSQGGLKTLTEGKKSIKPSDIVTIGADATIVSTYIELKLEAQGEEGGLKGALNDAKANAKDAAEEASNRIKDAAGTTRDKATELGEELSQKAQEAREVVVEKSRDARDNTADAIEDMQAKSNEIANDIKSSTQKNSDDLAREAQEKLDDIRATTKSKADEASDKLNELANTTKKRMNNVKNEIKDSATDNGRTSNHKSGKMVKESKQRYEDEETVVETEKKVVKK